MTFNIVGCRCISCGAVFAKLDYYCNNWDARHCCNEDCENVIISSYSDDCVVVSEYEAYLSWFALEGFEIFSDITMEEYPLCTRVTIEEEMDEDEIRSALFGYWNEKVRR